MNCNIVENILKKEGYSRIIFDETIGWDVIALKNDVPELIEIKETEGKDYFRRNSYSCTRRQKRLFDCKKLKILFIYYNKNKSYQYKFLVRKK